MSRIEIGEAGDFGIELQFDGAGRAVALLADDDFGLAMDTIAFPPAISQIARGVPGAAPCICR